MSTPALRVALVADLSSERWPSMDLVADMLFANLRTDRDLQVDMLRPTLRNRRPGIGRYVNRYWDYARWLRSRSHDFDIFHVVDHSYAHLVHVLPAQRTLVTCHDTDAFMPLVDARVVPTRLPKAVTRLILSGMRKAACVACDSTATFDELRQFDLADADRMTVVPLGVHPALLAEPDADSDAVIDAHVGVRRNDVIELLHVGSCIKRKRIDVLLRVLHAVRSVEPRARLLKAGGTLTPEQVVLAQSLGVSDHIVQLPFLDVRSLAALYRRANAVLVTSEREGFGLPVVEALAAGVGVVATDIPVLREAGGTDASFAPLDDIDRWRDTLLQVLREAPATQTARLARAESQSQRFRWSECADHMARLYRRVDMVAREGARFAVGAMP